jgi:hypothetical protein
MNTKIQAEIFLTYVRCKIDMRFAFEQKFNDLSPSFLRRDGQTWHSHLWTKTKTKKMSYKTKVEEKMKMTHKNETKWNEHQKMKEVNFEAQKFEHRHTSSVSLADAWCFKRVATMVSNPLSAAIIIAELPSWTNNRMAMHYVVLRPKQTGDHYWDRNIGNISKPSWDCNLRECCNGDNYETAGKISSLQEVITETEQAFCCNFNRMEDHWRLLQQLVAMDTITETRECKLRLWGKIIAAAAYGDHS